MPGGRWKFIQKLNKGKVEWPIGEVTKNSDETLIQLEATVSQGSTGATQTTLDTKFVVPGQWTADTLVTSQGQFKSGEATGIAFLITRDNNTGNNLVTWWISPLDLQ